MEILLAIKYSIEFYLPLTLMNLVWINVNINIVPIWCILLLISCYPFSVFIKKKIEQLEGEENGTHTICNRTDN